MEAKKGPDYHEQSVQHQYDHEQTKRLNEGRKFYKPFILRTPVLSTLLVVTLILIGVLEIACRRLPNAPNRGVVTSISNGAASLGVRQESGTTESLPIPDVTIIDSASDTTSSSIETPVTPPVAPIVVEGPSIQTVTETQVIDGTTRLVAYEESYGVPACTSDPPICEYIVGSHWLRVGTRVIPQSVVAGINTGSAGGDGLVGGGVTHPAEGPSGVPTAPGVVQQPGVTNTDPAATVAGPSNTLAAATGGPLETEVPSAVVTNAAGTFDASGKILSATITTGPSYTTGKGSKPTSTAGGRFADESSDGAQKLPNGSVYFVFTNAQYFSGAFLSTIIAILFTIPWGFVETAAKEIEPYIQLSGSAGSGAPARQSLSLDYSSTLIILMPFKSLYHGHFIVFLASLMNILALFTAPLAAESVFIGLRGSCGRTSDADLCIPTLSVFVKSARVLEAIMGFMALCLLALIIMNRRRSSGVYSNPHSLAATASLFHSPPLLEVFRSLPLGIKESKLGQFLTGHTYGLGYYTNHSGSLSYGFLLDPHGVHNPNGIVEYSHVNLNEQEISEKPSTQAWHTTLLRFVQVIAFFICLLGLLGMIVLYRFVSVPSVFEDFMNSEGFGPRFLFTTLGVLTCQTWYYIRAIIHENEPYQNLLSPAGATAKNSILIKPTPIALLSIVRSARRGALLLTAIDLCTILCELLTIALANIPYSPGNTINAFKICVYIALVIIAVMLVTLLVIMLQIGRFGGGAQVQRTLAGKMRLFISSGLGERFKALGDRGENERVAFVEGMRGRYRIGAVTGWDGTRRFGVDLEEFVDR